MLSGFVVSWCFHEWQNKENHTKTHENPWKTHEIPQKWWVINVDHDFPWGKKPHIMWDNVPILDRPMYMLSIYLIRSISCRILRIDWHIPAIHIPWVCSTFAYIWHYIMSISAKNSQHNNLYKFNSLILQSKNFPLQLPSKIHHKPSINVGTNSAGPWMVSDHSACTFCRLRWWRSHHRMVPDPDAVPSCSTESSRTFAMGGCIGKTYLLNMIMIWSTLNGSTEFYITFITDGCWKWVFHGSPTWCHDDSKGPATTSNQLQLAAGHVVRNVYYAIGYAEADFPDVSLPSTITAVGDHLGRIRCFQGKSIGSCCFLDPNFWGCLSFL